MEHLLIDASSICSVQTQPCADILKRSGTLRGVEPYIFISPRDPTDFGSFPGNIATGSGRSWILGAKITVGYCGSLTVGRKTSTGSRGSLVLHMRVAMPLRNMPFIQARSGLPTYICLARTIPFLHLRNHWTGRIVPKYGTYVARP